MGMSRGIIIFFILSVSIIAGLGFIPKQFRNPEVLSEATEAPQSHWFLLHRKSNIEYFYHGEPGNPAKSILIKTFHVKTGIPNERPTPLPKLAGRDYWIITDKNEETENPETMPYFLTLDVPVGETEPYGPSPYNECNGQCNWIVPGTFGLHGVGGNPAKLAPEDPGSSGCIRHADEDITYLYNTLQPEKEEIRYYIEDV